MMGTALPQSFLDKMRRLLGGEYEAWLASYEKERQYGLRVNALKITPEAFIRLSPMGADLTPIPWTNEGFYYREQHRPGKHPHYHAGLYYIQEPSAMVPGELLDVRPGDKVLDLCAAPGGKSTQLAAKLSGLGLLVANDNAAERTKALAKNIELAGVRNAVVLNEEPSRLAGVFPGFFDKILVDAPCSGEGMFRKDESMIAQWEKHSVERCSLMQRDILRHAADMLAPGGTLVYSTCTFSPEENESQIASLLSERQELEVVYVPLRHGWAPGRPEWTAAGNGSRPLEADAVQAVAGTVRLWPHLTAGEGHYAAVLRHKGTREGGSAVEPETITETLEIRSSGLRPAETGEAKAAARRKKPGRDPSVAAGREPRERGGRADGKGKLRRNGSAGSDERKQERAVSPVLSWQSFASEHLNGADQWQGVLINFGSRLYLQPHGLPHLDGLRVIRAGWYLGEAGVHRFEPSQALAMGLRPEEAARTLSLASASADTERYLRGDTIEAEPGRIVWRPAVGDSESGENRKSRNVERTADSGENRNVEKAAESGSNGNERSGSSGGVSGIHSSEAPVRGAKGYVLVLVDGYPVGWGKWDGAMLKNGLAPGWRRL
jgi:NOL1/NOP2/sun family putative RNA methylase